MTHKQSRELCAIVLAGSGGDRLQPGAAARAGAGLPRPYVRVTGGRSLLQDTFHRLEKLIRHERIFTVVDRDHLAIPEVQRQLADRPASTVLAQPRELGTGLELLRGLMAVRGRFADATVAALPSDHLVLEEDLFMGHLLLACRASMRNSSWLVLLGMQPDRADEEYDYIVPIARASNMVGFHGVSRFVERPSALAASELVRAGALWNMKVMAFRPTALLDLVRREFPDTYRDLTAVSRAVGSPAEEAVLEEVYSRTPPLDLSRDLLDAFARRSSALRVLPVKGVLWSDWSSDRGAREAISALGHRRASRRSVREAHHEFGPADEGRPWEVVQ